MTERKRQPTPEELAAWEKRLKDEGLLTLEEEGRGVHFGAEGAEDMEQVPTDEVEQQIIEQLREEGENNHYVGSPENYKVLVEVTFQVISDIAKQNQRAKVALHVSCITGDDCIIVFEPKGERHHINTGRATGYNREKFLETLVRKGVAVKEIEE